MCHECIGYIRDEPENWCEDLHGSALKKLCELGEGIIKQFTDRPEVARDLAAWGYIKSRSESTGKYGNTRQVYYI